MTGSEDLNGHRGAPAENGHPHDEMDPREILEWASATVDRLALATSFQSSGLVLLHLMRDIRPDVPVLFLNTGFHFQETLDFSREIAESWDLKLVELRGEHGSPERQAETYGDQLYRKNPDLCCAINKVKPLQRALEEYDGWISGVRRDQSPLRAASVRIAQPQMLPSGRGIMKIHPLANWTKNEVDDYVRTHGIPTNPLIEQGYASIGCWPCTQKVGSEEDDRAGRWRGLDKTECGIHTFGEPSESRETEAEQ
jgi:phosphoadenosine phosphosulfate reductase